jgi:peptidoglycan/LPS O-acetylase OafA/YrhL
VVRFRRGSELERAQLKWLILAGVASVVFLMLPFDHGNGDWVDILGGLVWALLPISVGVAILRYRLYEIDRIISRTVTYTAVIVMIVAVYFVVVGSISVLLPEAGAPAVAAATLAAAALFRPLLSRVKVAVDRRFNRSRYDARIAADEFAQRVRDDTDTDGVEADLVSSVTRAMEPSLVSLWVRHP